MDQTALQVLFPPATERRRWRWVRDCAEAGLDLIFPPHCVSCGLPMGPGVNKALCLPCAEKIHWIGPDRCLRCGDATGDGSGAVSDCSSCRSYPPVFVQSICAVARYAEGPLRDLILGLKFGHKLHLTPVLGELLAARLKATALVEPGWVVVPAPLTAAAARKRGFNQAEELARRVARRLGLACETRLLLKTRSTPPQATLSREERRVNVKGAFGCLARLLPRYQGARILLIDDVITTGSTVSECARALVQAGIGAVRAASVARG